MKFFSLLSNQEVRLAPGKKVIPAAEFTTLQEAHDILQRAQDEIAAAHAQAQEDAAQSKEEGYRAGYQEGLVALNGHLLVLDKELKEIREEVHKKILPLALKAAKKIIGEELKLHPDRIVDIVLTALKPVTQHRKISIYVNRADLEMLEASKSKIKKIFEHLESLSLQERPDIEPGGCIIETEAGIINAQLENQWRALESAFESFMRK